MGNKILTVFIISLLFLAGGPKPVFAVEHSQEDGLLSMDIPAEWHWVENPQEIVIAYPDGKTVAIDIQLALSTSLSQDEIKKTIKESNDKMIHQGIEAHQGTLIDQKDAAIDGVYATQLDFKTAAPNPVLVTYISFIHKGYAVTVTYGSEDDKMHAVLDDVVATLKLK